MAENPADHVAFTLNNALEDYECGWASWEEVEERICQSSAYYHWLYREEVHGAQDS